MLQEIKLDLTKNYKITLMEMKDALEENQENVFILWFLAGSPRRF